MNMNRRVFLKRSGAAGAAAAAVAAGLVTPQAVLAEWNEAAFKAESVDESMKALMGADAAEASGDIAIKAPDIAENGAVVPVSVTTTLEGVEMIAIMAAANPRPMTAGFTFGPGAMSPVGTRIKMGKTGAVVALVKAGGKVYKAEKEVKVTIGGCGG